MLKKTQAAVAAATLSACLAALAALFALSAHMPRDLALAWVNPAVVKELSMYDTSPEDSLFRLSLLLIAAAALIATLARRQIAAWAERRSASAFAFLTAAWFFLLGAYCFRQPAVPFFDQILLSNHGLALVAVYALSLLWIRSGFGESPSRARLQTAGFTAGIVLMLGLYVSVKLRMETFDYRVRYLACAALLCLAVFARPRPRSRLQIALLASILAAAIAAVAIGYRHAGDLSNYSDAGLALIEQHMSSFGVGAGARLAAGKSLYAQVHPLYGLFVPVLIAVLNHSGRAIGMGGFISLTEAISVVFLVVSVLVYYAYSGGDALMALLAAALSSWVIGREAAYYPGQSAVRYLGVAVFFGALLASRRAKGRTTLFALAALLGLLLIYNPETGVALCAAFLVYLWLLQPDESFAVRARRCAAAGAVVFASALASFAAVSAGLRLAGGNGSSLSSANVLQFLEIFSKGFGGVRFETSIIPFVIGIHAVVVLILVSSGVAAGSSKNAFRAAAAVFILVWGAYYVNRPALANLKGHIWVYAFFLIDTLRFLRARRSGDAVARAVQIALPVCLLVLTALPLLADSAGEVRDSRREGLAADPRSRPGVSGVAVSPAVDASLAGARAVWKRYAVPGSKCVILTRHPLLLASLTCQSDLTVSDALGEAVTVESYDRLVREIRASGAPVIFFDDNAAPGAGEAGAYFAGMQRDVSGSYRRLILTPDLDVWTRRP